MEAPREWLLATVLVAVAHGLTLINQGTLISSTLVTRPPKPGPALPLSGEDVEHIRWWRSLAGNLQVASLPGWGAGWQRGDPGGRGPTQLQEGRVQGLCQKRSGLEPPTIEHEGISQVLGREA